MCPFRPLPHVPGAGGGWRNSATPIFPAIGHVPPDPMDLKPMADSSSQARPFGPWRLFQLPNRPSWVRACAQLLIAFVTLAILNTPLAADPLLQHLRQFCGECHQGEAAEAGIAVDVLTIPITEPQRKAWERVFARIRSGEMPPKEATQPSSETRQELVSFIQNHLKEESCQGPRDPGRAIFRRMNRIEFQNTVRDILGIDMDMSLQFPSDELAFGFDNNGDMLSLSPLWLEALLAVSEEISYRAFKAPEQIHEPKHVFPQETWQHDDTWDGGQRRLLTNGKISVSWSPPKPGRYLVRCRVTAEHAGEELPVLGFYQEEQLIGSVGIEATGEEKELRCCLLELGDGECRLGLGFLNDHYDPENEDEQRRDRNLVIHDWEVVGPLEKSVQDLPSAHARFLQAGPTLEQWQDETAWKEPAGSVLGKLLSVLYRRPATVLEVDQMLQLLQAVRAEQASYENAMQVALQAALSSTSFLLIAPPKSSIPDDLASFTPAPIDEFRLASRLSYFLWSSAPDKELLRLAWKKDLANDLEKQVRRMLADPKVEDLAKNFSGQWLQTRKLVTHEVSSDAFPEYDLRLRDAMLREVDLLFLEMIRTDQPVHALLDTTTSFVNERLAKHYGIEGVVGEEFRAISLPTSQRAGVITTAAVLTVTSLPNRTSPVLRGKWLLGQVLADEPPPPPPGVPDLSRQAKPDHPESLREMLARHRADPSCAICHDRMDPLGLTLEKYDGIGRYRGDSTGDAETIDDSGTLPDGKVIRGASELRQHLALEKEAFRKVIAEKLLLYALGRGLEPYDDCTLRDIVAKMEVGGDRFSALVLAIVQSAPFCQERSSP